MPFSIPTGDGVIELRQAVPADLETITAVMLDAAQMPRSRGFTMWTWLGTPLGQQILGKRIETFLLAELDGEPIGTMRLDWSDPQMWGARGDDGQAGYVHNLAVIGRLQGKGIGVALLDWATAQIRARKRTLQRLDCRMPNPPLSAFYERLGFRKCGLKELPDFTVQLFERTIQTHGQT